MFNTYSQIFSLTLQLKTRISTNFLRIRQLKKLEKEFEDIFWSGNSFEDLYETLNFNQTDPKSKLFCAAILEWKKSKTQFENDTSGINSLKDPKFELFENSFEGGKILFSSRILLIEFFVSNVINWICS